MSNISIQTEVTVCIPLYSNTPSPLEMFSFIQCCKILGRYPLTIVTFKELHISLFTKKLDEYNIKYEVKYFDKSFFKDINGYNQLMVSPAFYESLSAFKFLLIYQLDAFVFSDQLSEWCAKDYDYIGAPWLNLKWINNKEIEKQLPLFTRLPYLFKLFKGKDGLVGNGGFSLRKVSSHIKFAKVYSSVFSSLNFNEDLFWGKYVAANETDFKIPLMLEALSFSIESDPSVAFALLSNGLPFGCHAWYKNDEKIWQMIFNKAGIDLSRIPNV
jgi:hypothetical protein